LIAHYRVLNEKQQAQNVALAADKIAATAAVNIADKNLPIHCKLFDGKIVPTSYISMHIADFYLSISSSDQEHEGNFTRGIS